MSVFKFKQFEVDQSGCAMKINTDGVLVAAIANHNHPKDILDIGTGTGVIALMLAQRFPEAFVHAVEIDEQSAVAAGRNFQQSAFNERLSVHHTAIAHYGNSLSYDLIVSNPPFFVNDLKNEEVRKGIARHASEEFFINLIHKADELLSKDGKFWLILPVKQAKDLVKIAEQIGLVLVGQVHIHSDRTKPMFRQILCFGRNPDTFFEQNFYIYESQGNHTAAYKELLKPFFLAF